MTKERRIVEAWLANKSLERLERYLKRGRPYARVSMEQLRDSWVALTRAWAENAPFPPQLEDIDDIEAEMNLRKVEPPVDQVTDAVETLRCKVKAAAEALLKDPLRFAQMERELCKEIDEFEAVVRLPKN